MIITIDGPAGSGKSTIAKEVSKRLSFSLLDTGALYRAVAYAADQHQIDCSDEPSVVTFLKKNPLTLLSQKDGMHFIIAGIDTTPFLRDQRIGHLSSVVSSYHDIRQQLLSLQQNFAKGVNIVCEGRDMGSTVFPQADLKIFLIATTKVRAARRFAELQNIDISFEQVQKEIEERDRRDSSREHSPLVQPKDATVIDTSALSIPQVVETLLFLARRLLAEQSPSSYWEHFQHQADVGIRGVGITPAQAFEQAAVSLMAVMTDLKTVHPRMRIPIQCEGDTLENLFIEYLNRIIYEVSTKKMLFRCFHVTVMEHELHAELWGEPIDRSVHEIAVEIKGATYHSLRVQEQKGLWFAESVVDV